MNNKNIRCTVSSCHYWGQGNYCEAEQILVSSDNFANETEHSINALQASTIEQTPVGSCQETCCKTYIQKGKNDIYHDNIRKTR